MAALSGDVQPAPASRKRSADEAELGGAEPTPTDPAAKEAVEERPPKMARPDEESAATNGVADPMAADEAASEPTAPAEAEGAAPEPAPFAHEHP